MPDRSPPQTTRRELVTRGLALTAGVGLTASSAQATTIASVARGTIAAARHDLNILDQLLDAEHVLNYVYEQVLNSGRLKRAALDVTLLAFAYEQEHVSALEKHAEQLRGIFPKKVNPPRKHPRPFPPERIKNLFQDLKTESDWLGVLVEVKNLLEYNYFSAASNLTDPALIRLAAQILANEAQLWTMLLDLLHKGDPTQAIPHPFVRGSQQLRD